MELPKEKLCPKCGILKPASAYSIAKSSYKGKTYYSLQSRCKPCIVTHSKEYQCTHPRKYYRPKQKYIETTDLNHMKSPLNWNDMKGESTDWEYTIYPTCEAGHKYVGERCLPCKYEAMRIGV